MNGAVGFCVLKIFWLFNAPRIIKEMTPNKHNTRPMMANMPLCLAVMPRNLFCLWAGDCLVGFMLAIPYLTTMLLSGMLPNDYIRCHCEADQDATLHMLKCYKLRAFPLCLEAVTRVLGQTVFQVFEQWYIV